LIEFANRSAVVIYAIDRLKLTPTVMPGEYVVQIVITDTLTSEKHRTASQWADFEVVK